MGRLAGSARAASGFLGYYLSSSGSSVSSPSTRISRECEAGSNVLFRQIGKFSQNLLVGHSRGQIIKHIVNRDAKSTNAGFLSSLASWLIYVAAIRFPFAAYLDTAAISILVVLSA